MDQSMQQYVSNLKFIQCYRFEDLCVDEHQFIRLMQLSSVIK